MYRNQVQMQTLATHKRRYFTALNRFGEWWVMMGILLPMHFLEQDS